MINFLQFTLLQADVAPGLLQDPTGFLTSYLQTGMEKAVLYAPKILLALIIFWIGSFISKRIHARIIKTVTNGGRLDPTLGRFFANMAKYVIFLAGLMAALSVLGIPVGRVFVILSAAVFAIGLALQGSMSNVAAGFLLIVLRPYKVGDYVELAGVEGTVEDLNIFATVLQTVDNVKLIIANAEVRGNTIKNLTTLGKRRVDVDFGIDYGDDIDKAIKIIKDTAAKDSRVLSDPEGPWAKVALLNDSSVDIQMRVWCESEVYWDVRFDLIKDIKEAFDKGGISIPYPHVVEIVKR